MPAALVGRDDELDLIESFVERVDRGPSGLVFSGDPGVGKTMLWQVAVDRAREGRAIVLTYRGVEAEANIAFAALSDLLADVLDDSLPQLPIPRRRALEVALLLEDAEGQPPEQRAVGLAVADILATLTCSGPVFVAIDDIQWLDRSSARVLQFALRRLRGEPVGLLATQRKGSGLSVPLDVSNVLHTTPVEQVALQPLSLATAYQLLKSRLGLVPSRPQLVRLHELTAGNPYYLLELGRELKRTDVMPGVGQPLAVPHDLGELLARRLERLPAKSRDMLLTIAALPRPTLNLLVEAHGGQVAAEEAIERAVEAGIVELEGSRIRFAHPLLASICYQAAPPWRRRALHRQLAALVSEPEARARHLALAADGPDAVVAAALERAGKRAAARGATAAAAELTELAAEATPHERAADARRRRLEAAELHRLAGDRDRAVHLLDRLLGETPAGSERADVLFALAQGRRANVPRTLALCEEALVEAQADDARRTRILAFISWMRLIAGNVAGAVTAARRGLSSAERLDDPALLAPAIARVAMAETWALDITPGLVERGVALEEALDQPLQFHESPRAALARRLIALSDFDRARALLEDATARAAARADEGTRAHVLFHLTMLEWFAGRWERALAHAAAGLELADQLRDEQCRGMLLHARALVEAHMGEVDSARAAAAEAATIAEAVSDAIFPIWNQAVLGHSELSLGNLDAAAAHLGPLPQRLLSLGWNDPADSVWPDSIEALAGVGALEQASAYLERFEELARRSRSLWALATAARCRGLLAAAEGNAGAAFAAFEDALDKHRRFPEGRFELGRTLLALGSTKRRARQKRPARETLEQAVDIFDLQGARVWAGRARDELERISGRRPGSSQLTPSEERVAGLAAEGLANKEIASTLFMSVHTVEAHLSRVYRKLSVRSRTELARHAAFATEAPPKT